MTLRPRPGLLLDGTLTVAAAAAKMQESNADAALVVALTEEGALEGIITDSDVTRKVLAKRLDPTKVSVAAVMTRDPQSVTDEQNASEALMTMIEVRCRHLPVLGSKPPYAQRVIGVLDVVKCLFDAISTIESSNLPGGDVTLETLLAAAASGRLGGGAGSHQGPSAAAAAPSRWSMSNLFGSSSSKAASPSPSTLASILPSASVQQASEMMAARKGAVLVNEGKSSGGGGGGSGHTCCGILTPKDLLFRVVARGLDPAHTLVSQVMTPSPDCISSSSTILDALHQLQGSGYRQLPVVDAASGTPEGVVDVLTLIQGAMHLGESSSAAAASSSTAATAVNTPTAAPASASPPATRPAEVDVSGSGDSTDDVEATGPGSPFICVDSPSSGSSGSSGSSPMSPPSHGEQPSSHGEQPSASQIGDKLPPALPRRAGTPSPGTYEMVDALDAIDDEVAGGGGRGGGGAAGGGAAEAGAAGDGSSCVAPSRFLFKVSHVAGDGSVATARLDMTCRLLPLQRAVAMKLTGGGSAALPGAASLAYCDDDGECTILRSDADLHTAVEAAKRGGKTRLALHAGIPNAATPTPAVAMASSKMPMVLIGVCAVALVGFAGYKAYARK